MIFNEGCELIDENFNIENILRKLNMKNLLPNSTNAIDIIDLDKADECGEEDECSNAFEFDD